MIDEIFEWVQSVNTPNYLDAGWGKLVSLQGLTCASNGPGAGGVWSVTRSTSAALGGVYQNCRFDYAAPNGAMDCRADPAGQRGQDCEGNFWEAILIAGWPQRSMENLGAIRPLPETCQLGS